MQRDRHGKRPIPVAEAKAPTVIAVRAVSGRATILTTPETIANNDRTAPFTKAFGDPMTSWATCACRSCPANVRKAFATASVAMMTAYTHGVLILSLGGPVAHDLIGSPNALVNGAVLSLFAIVSGVVSIVARSLTARTAMTLGAFASATGMGLLAMAVALHGLPIFLLATVMAGAGYSLLFLSALQVMNTAAPAQHRGAVLSALYLLAYLSMGMVAISLGLVATGWGLRLATDLGAGVIALLSVATLALATAIRPSTLPSLPPGARQRLFQPVRSTMPEALKLYHAPASPIPDACACFSPRRHLPAARLHRSRGRRATWRRLSRN